MPEPLTPADLAAIRARADAATPGPWGASQNYLIGGWWVQTPEQAEQEWSLADFVRQEDAAFIAAAREDVPRLVAEVERLREALAGLVDDEPCRYDHSGACQEHGVSGPPCAMAVARAALGREP